MRAFSISWQFPLLWPSSRGNYICYESSRARCEKEVADEVQLIIPDKAHRNVLLASVGEEKWRLPGSLGEDIDTVSIPAFRSYVKDEVELQFGFIVLRQVHSQVLKVERHDLDATLYRSVIVVECIEEPGDLPTGLQWVPIVDDRQGSVVNVVHSEEDAQHEIHRELYGIANDVRPARRVPWAFPRWYENTTIWLRKCFDRHGLRVIGPIEQIRTSARSTVLKINTRGSFYYLKCSVSTSNDAGVTSVMFGVAPDLVRKPFDVDVEQRLMVLKDHGEDFGAHSLSDESLQQFMKTLARLHKTSASAFGELLEVGLPVYSTQWMADNLDGLLNAKELAFMQHSSLWESLLDIKKRVIDALGTFASWDMPYCLVRNDTYEGNLTRNPNEACKGFYFSDFDCSFGGHPVWDLISWNRKPLEAYAEEMGITDLGGWCALQDTACRLSPLVSAFRYIDFSEGSRGRRSKE